LNPLFEKAVIESSGHSSGGHYSSDDSYDKKMKSMKMNKKRKLADYLSSTFIAGDHQQIYAEAKRVKHNYV
jgi:hypothetical protein